MSARISPVARWLAWAAAAEWLIGRTLTRSAIYMPKTPAVIAVYQILGWTGRLALTLEGLLLLSALGWIAWGAWRRRGARTLPALIVIHTGLSLCFLVVAPGGWPAVVSQLVGVALIGVVAYAALRSSAALGQRLPIYTVGAALLGGAAYRLIVTLYATQGWPGPPAFGNALFVVGEALVVCGALAAWWAYGRSATRAEWLLGAPPALGFVALRTLNPAMAGILTIWSTGLTLVLPWPLYAAALWLAGVTLLTSLRRGQPVGWALLLLASAGYAGQLSAQFQLGLIGLWLLGAQANHGASRHESSPAPRHRIEDAPVGAQAALSVSPNSAT